MIRKFAWSTADVADPTRRLRDPRLALVRTAGSRGGSHECTGAPGTPEDIERARGRRTSPTGLEIDLSRRGLHAEVGGGRLEGVTGDRRDRNEAHTSISPHRRRVGLRPA